MKTFRPLITIFLLWLIASLAQAQDAEQSSQEVDYIELAALMLRDNHLDRAEMALQQVDLQHEDTDQHRFYSLKGLLAVKKGQHQIAMEAFSQANNIKRLEPNMQMILAQAAFSAAQYQRSIQALDEGGTALQQVAESYHLRAQAHWQLNEKPMALAIINVAMARFPSESAFLKRKIFYLVALELHAQAAELGLDYVAKYDVSADDYLAIGMALKNAGNRERGLSFLETAHLYYPKNEDIIKALAAAYVEKQHYLSAANIVHKLAMTNNDYMSEAAELFRKAGYKHQALILNGLITDQSEKLTQRLGLLIELALFDQAVALKNDLIRTRLLQQDDIRYAMAFTHFKLGQYQETEGLLSELTEPRYIEQALQIRDYMNQCRQQPWLCQ